MSAVPQFQKARRRSVRLKLGIQGPAGSGKTKGALHLARAIVGPSGRIAVVDTENRTSEFYADQYDFDVLYVEPPYLTSKFIEAMLAAHQAGYDIVILDTISHQWMGEGGILDRKEQEDGRGGNSFTNWGKFTKEMNRFRDAILNYPRHLICTMRTKQEYVLGENAKGKQEPRKMGMAPQVRDGIDYEFGVVFDLQMDHRAKQSKDRTELFRNGLWDLLSDEPGIMLRDWLRQATEEDTPSAPGALSAVPVAESVSDIILPGLKLFPDVKGKRLGDLPGEVLDAMYRAYRETKPNLSARLAEELEDRRASAVECEGTPGADGDEEESEGPPAGPHPFLTPNPTQPSAKQPPAMAAMPAARDDDELPF